MCRPGWLGTGERGHNPGSEGCEPLEERRIISQIRAVGKPEAGGSQTRGASALRRAVISLLLGGMISARRGPEG